MIGWLIVSLIPLTFAWYWCRYRMVRSLATLLVSGYARQIILACDALDKAAAEHQKCKRNLNNQVDSLNATSPKAVQRVIEEIETRKPKRLRDVRRGIFNNGGFPQMLQMCPGQAHGEPLDPKLAAMTVVMMAAQIRTMHVSDFSAVLAAVEELAEPQNLEMAHKLIALAELGRPGNMGHGAADNSGDNEVACQR
jgi:hypothetical protein